MEVSKTAQEHLPRLKRCVEKAYKNFKPNYDTFHKFNQFVFESTIDERQKTILDALNKPVIEFNIMEMYVNILIGEFLTHEPSINVLAEPGSQVDPRLMRVVEDHLRHEINEGEKNGFQGEIFKDIVGGGFGVAKVYTDYANPMGFEQVIKFKRAFDPTLTGADPLAETPHKGDGSFWFELYPRTKEDFNREHPQIKLDSIMFTRQLGEFNWAYNNQEDDILLMCDFYEKKMKRTKIALLSNGKTIVADKYDEFIQQWNASGTIEQAPVIQRTRWTNLETICRYIFIETTVLKYEETDYSMFPLVFGDGNSRRIRKGHSGQMVQRTRPYVWNLVGIQKLKNLAGQSLAQELENITQQKIKVAKEALPDEDDWLAAYTNPQEAAVMVYNGFLANNPDVPLPPPQEMTRTPIPPELSATFAATDQTANHIMGANNMERPTGNRDMSGKAMFFDSVQSFASSKPYLDGYLQLLQRIAEIYIDLLPKYYVTKRTIPVLLPDGKRDYVKINQEGGIDFNYDSNALKVRVEAGPSFSLQKLQAFDQIVALMRVSPLFAQFINSKGLEALLDNVEIRNIDQLKLMAQEYMKELQMKEQLQMQAMQKAAQENPEAKAAQALLMSEETKRMKVVNDAKFTEMDKQIEVAKVAQGDRKLDIEERKADNQLVQTLAEIENKEIEAEVRLDGHQTEKLGKAVDLAIKAADLSHTHNKEAKELHHTIKQAEREATQQARQTP